MMPYADSFLKLGLHVKFESNFAVDNSVKAGGRFGQMRAIRVAAIGISKG